MQGRLAGECSYILLPVDTLLQAPTPNYSTSLCCLPINFAGGRCWHRRAKLSCDGGGGGSSFEAVRVLGCLALSARRGIISSLIHAIADGRVQIAPRSLC